MTITIFKMTLGPVHTNCYILGDEESGDAVVIDPSDRAQLLYDTASEEGFVIREILATHGHFDHVMASAELKKLTSAPFRFHEEDLSLVQNMPQTVLKWLGITRAPAAEPDSFVQDGDTITVGGIVLEVLHTPGHSPGHVSYVLRSNQTVFCGDVLFRGSIGRTDLPNSNYNTLMQSITTKLLPLGDDFIVAPGHADNTTIGHERRHNGFIREYLANTRPQS